jgi:TrmH family RNA methyltransferase
MSTSAPAAKVPIAELIDDGVVVVLVEPQHPGNVGAAARAMKNFGLSRLVLVAPPCYDPEQARWMAPGCDDLLARAKVVANLDEALAGVHRVIASTARHRKQGQPVYEPAEVAQGVLDDIIEQPGYTTAILFGREDFGLSTADVHRAESILRIPTPEHASLNLGQAVLLVAHSLFEEGRARGLAATGRTLGGSRGARSTRSARPRGPDDQIADAPTVEPAVSDLVALLDRVGYLRGLPADKVMLTARQALQRARVSVRHVSALRGMVSRLAWALDNPGVDWRATRREQDQKRNSES